MKSNFQKIAVLCTCTGLLCSCGQSDNKQEHHKEFIPITILHPTTIEFPRSYVADVQAIEGGNLAASKIRNLECPSYEICLIDYGCGKFNRKIHIMEQYP